MHEDIPKDPVLLKHRLTLGNDLEIAPELSLLHIARGRYHIDFPTHLHCEIRKIRGSLSPAFAHIQTGRIITPALSVLSYVLFEANEIVVGNVNI